MPGRQSHGIALSSQPAKARKNNRKQAKRSQNAFAIAQQENEEKVKVRRSRLGDLEGPIESSRKRGRDDDEGGEDENEEEETDRGAKKNKKSKFDSIDVDEGSDSEGNEWKMGDVDADDDSDLDSDEAFGESDEEKFDGYAFSGSQKKPHKKAKPARALDLDEDEESDEAEADSDDDSLGSEAVDLATMLDQASDSEDEADGKTAGSDSDEDSEDGDSDDESSISSIDDDDAQNPEKLAALQSLVANLPHTATDASQDQRRNDSASEYNAPSGFGVTSRTKLTLDDLGLGAVRDPTIKKSLKFLDPESKKKSATLTVPLAKRQQDRLDRAAAFEKSKETLDKWKDTVAHNRRADHLVFPLPDADMSSLKQNAQLQSTAQAKPFNELEAAIQSIMEESGLAPGNGKDDEDKLRGFEELQEQKMSIEDIKARRAQLRMARELMFREEAKAKRIKKIKSKSYRKVHRKEREREEQKAQQALLEAGIEPDEDEREAQDRRRAEERMGDKHRGSKWAKATKAIGRAAWDADARSGITEMARRDEELRRRIEGRDTRRSDDEFTEESDGESEDEESDEEVSRKRLLGQLNKLNSSSERAGPGSKLANMDFMLRGEAAKKQQNDEMVEEIRRELADEDSQDDESEQEEGDVGRRTFGPAAVQKATIAKAPLQEFEERELPDDDEEEEIEITIANPPTDSKVPAIQTKNGAQAAQRGRRRQGISRASTVHEVEVADPTAGAWTKVTKKNDASSMSEEKRRRQGRKATEADELDFTNASAVMPTAKPAAKKKKRETKVIGEDSDDSEDDEKVRLPFAIRDQELVKRAFAGADVVGDFEAEKRKAVEEDDEKIVDNTLPGWGSWTGDGLSKKEKKKNTGRFLTKTAGIKEADRKDAKLKNVIISEKRVKKVRSYIV